MQEKTERNPKRKNEFDSAIPSCPSSPVPSLASHVDTSPYIGDAPSGYDLSYSYSSWKHRDDPAYTPNGHEKKRRKYEGSTHLYLKLGALNFDEDNIPRLPEHQVHAIVARVLNASKRIEADILKARTPQGVEPGHFYYATRLIRVTLDLILNVYLSCQNRQDYLNRLNKHIMENDFFNPFKIKVAYEFSEKDKKTLALLRPECFKYPVCEQDIKLVLIDQLFRLKEAADQDYYSLYQKDPLSWQSSAKKTVEFARSCFKKIAEFCRFFNTDETLAFLSELNTIIRKKGFYHPQVLVSLYLNDCKNYDIHNANTDVCFKELTLDDLETISENEMRKIFWFEPLTPKVRSVSSTVSREITETFDEYGHLRERKSRITKEERTLFFSPTRTAARFDDEDDFQDDKRESFNYSSSMK